MIESTGICEFVLAVIKSNRYLLQAHTGAWRKLSECVIYIAQIKQISIIQFVLLISFGGRVDTRVILSFLPILFRSVFLVNSLASEFKNSRIFKPTSIRHMVRRISSVYRINYKFYNP